VKIGAAIPIAALTIAVATTIAAVVIAEITVRATTPVVEATTAAGVVIRSAALRTAQHQCAAVAMVMVATIAETASFWITPPR
jgi:hypothetical protein